MKAKPMEQTARYLFLVSGDQPDLYEHLRREFSTDEEVEVLRDRRVAGRRRRVQAYQPERRRGDRRSQPGVDNELRSLGFVIVRTHPPSKAQGNPL